MSIITSQAEYDSRYPNVPLERWRNNVIEAVAMIADKDGQETTWQRDDRAAWECPDELICILFDDSLFELFLIDCNFSLSEPQREAAHSLLSKLNSFLDDTPGILDSAETLNNPRWEEIRVAARHFVAKFSA